MTETTRASGTRLDEGDTGVAKRKIRKGDWKLNPLLQGAAPFAAVVLVLTAFAWSYRTFALCEAPISWLDPACAEETKPQHIRTSLSALIPTSRSHTARPFQYAEFVNWLSAISLHIVVCLGAYITGGYILLAETKLLSARYRAASLFAGLLFAALVVLILMGTPNYLLGEVLIEKTVQGSFNNIFFFVLLRDAASLYAAVLFSVLIGVVTGSRPGGGAHVIALKLKHLNVFLYVGTIVLVSAVFQSSFLNRWMLTFIQAEGNKEVFDGFKALADSFVLQRGFLYTLLLAALYIPASVLLRKRALELLPAGLAEKPLPQQEEWLKSEGLSFSTTEQLTRFAAILAPLMTGSTTELLALL